MTYPGALVGWLYDIMQRWDFTPAQILDSEDRYPGVWDDLAIEGWQRALMRQEVKDG